MKKKILLSAALLAALAAPAGVVQAANVLRTVGRHPVSAPLATVEDLRAMMRSMGNDIQDGMSRAGNAGLFPLVQAHIANNPSQIAIVAYQPGQQIDWMLFRQNGRGRVKVARDVTWGGSSPLSVFEFSVDTNGQRYTFAVPLQCGNLALKESYPAPVQVVQQQAPVIQYKEVVRQVPVPGPTVYVPKEVIKYVDRPMVREVVRQVPVPGPTVYVDRPVVKEVVRQVSVPGPTVYVPKEVIKYVDKPVQVVKYVDKPVVKTVVRKVRVPGPTRTVYVDKPVIKEVVKEVRGKAECCESPFRFVADAGYLRQSDTAEYGFGRLGMEYALNPQFSFLAMVGGAAEADGEGGEDAFLLDFMLQYNLFQCATNGSAWSPFFIGLGVGAWMTNGDDETPSEDSQADLIANIGLRLFGTPASTSVSIFLEGRAATDELDELDEYGRIGGGLRFRF
ncbi:MAG: IMCp domain-containing protein [Candidatus Electronema sp. V4]|uniref:IMCp domain-containing protein n=1 Tax=Candidatus Electronema sp. V4 TaxID=3454756 RepID=UPI0040554FFD